MYKERYEAPGRGMDVQLTIDSTIQGIVEREVDNLVKNIIPNRL